MPRRCLSVLKAVDELRESNSSQQKKIDDMRRAIASLCRDQAGTPCDDNTPFSELVSSLGNKMSSDKENLTTANRALDDFRCALYGSEEGQVAEGSDAKTKSEGLTSKVQELKSKLESAEASNKLLLVLVSQAAVLLMMFRR